MGLDRENEIFTTVKNEVSAKHNHKVFFYGTPRPDLETFPMVWFYEKDSSIAERHQPSLLEQQFIDSLFEAQIYTKTKGESKVLVNLIDDVMRRLGFHQTANMQLLNLNDNTVNRRVATWRGTYNNYDIYRR